MNTYTVNVDVGATVQITVSAQNEEEAELIASKKAAEIISDTHNARMLQNQIKIIDSEVTHMIENMSVIDIAEFKK